MFNGAQARVLRIDPAPGPATLLAIGPASQVVIGHSGRAHSRIGHAGAGRRRRC
jgi:hypothetical protein